MAKKYVMVRITEETSLALHRVRERLENAQIMKGRNPLPETEGFGITMDTVIRELIRRDTEHAARGRRKPARRRQPGGEDHDEGVPAVVISLE